MDIRFYIDPATGEQTEETMKKTNEFPSGWDEQRIRDVLEYYESQTDEEAAAQHDAALSSPEHTVMEVPAELVPVFRQLIAEHERKRASR
ncbi:MAG TPA: hypothetical protein VKM72_05115 [Thermoanaerobaculia bacterium]|nr:hypothetical protein [Thermoanaerobaculia bacterium]